MIKKSPRQTGQPLPRHGTAGATGRVLLNRAEFIIANLRFAAGATIDEHSAPIDINVICFDGEGFVSIDGQSSPLLAGECVLWPANVSHRLWTELLTMEILMVERTQL